MLLLNLNENKPEVELSKTFSKNTDDKFGGSGGKKFDNS